MKRKGGVRPDTACRFRTAALTSDRAGECRAQMAQDVLVAGED